MYFWFYFTITFWPLFDWLLYCQVSRLAVGLAVTNFTWTEDLSIVVVVVVCRCLTSRSIHHRSLRGRFYRPDDQTNSFKALKETSRSSRSGFNHTRTTPPCYNNTTLGNRLYAQRKGPKVTNPILKTWRSILNRCELNNLPRTTCSRLLGTVSVTTCLFAHAVFVNITFRLL